MKPKWQKLASLAQEICTLWFQFFGAVSASKGYPFKNIVDHEIRSADSRMVVRRLPCELNISCTSTTAESRPKIWYQLNAFKPPGGLGCCQF